MKASVLRQKQDSRFHIPQLGSGLGMGNEPANHGENGFLSSSKQANQKGKKVLHARRSCLYQKKASAHKVKSAFSAECSSVNRDRQKVTKALNHYQDSLHNLSTELKSSSEGKKGIGLKLHMEVARILKRQYKWVNTNKRIGHVPGIEVGDQFYWRAQLRVIGLHDQFYSGIDYMKDKVHGKTLATSIVFAGRYANDTFVYCGNGQNPTVCFKPFKPGDQKLERGNLALWNSMMEEKPVRVIRKISKVSLRGSTLLCPSSHSNLKQDGKFIYDGMYKVDDCWQERGQFGKLVFKFMLKRLPGQPELINWKN